MPRTDMILPGDVGLSRWVYHSSDGHSYKLYQSQGHLLLMAAPTNINDEPDLNCAFWMDENEHFADDQHTGVFCDEIAALMQVKPADIMAAIQ